MLPVVALRRFHALCTVLFLILIAPTLVWWQHSVPYLVWLSVWANVISHASAWQAARAEHAATEAMPDGQS